MPFLVLEQNPRVVASMPCTISDELLLDVLRSHSMYGSTSTVLEAYREVNRQWERVVDENARLLPREIAESGTTHASGVRLVRSWQPFTGKAVMKSDRDENGLHVAEGTSSLFDVFAVQDLVVKLGKTWRWPRQNPDR